MSPGGAQAEFSTEDPAPLEELLIKVRQNWAPLAMAARKLAVH
jgi:hypothetical protein